MDLSFSARPAKLKPVRPNLYLKNTRIKPNAHQSFFEQPQRFVYFLIFIVLPLLSWAQEYALSGRVMDPDNAFIPYADVVLQDKDAAVVKWTVTDDAGKFAIEDIKPGSYTLKVSIFGYATKTVDVDIRTDLSEQLITLAEETVTLDEVVLKKPRIEHRADGLVFNVQNTTLSNGNTWNVLAKTPYLFESGNEILVGGKDAPLVFINDKRVYLSASELKQLLENTPANTVKSVEVILTPSAKYDAEGKAVVNIVMSKNLSIGYNGTLSAAYEQGVYPKYRLSTGHFYKKDAINVYARYGFNNSKTYQFYRTRVNFFTDAMDSGSWLSETRDVMTTNRHDFSTNIDYTINDKHSLSLSGIASFIPNRKEFTASETQAIDSSFYSVNRGKYTRDNLVLSLDYKYDIGQGKQLTANVHHTNYSYDHDQAVMTDYFDADQNFMRDNNFTSNKDQHVKIHTAQVDYTSSGEKAVFEAGSKWSYITFDNDIVQENVDGEGMETTDHFLYEETNLAAYMNYDKSWESWGVKLGLRVENTHIKGVSSSEAQTNTQDYFKFFPAVYLSYKPSDAYSATLSYVKKINRPRFETLNPFRLFLNDNAYVTGNPNLRPTIQHRFNFTHSFKQSLSFSLYFNQSIDPIAEELPYINNEDNRIIYRNDNLDKNTEYGIYLQWSKTLNSWWEISVYSSLFHTKSDFFAGGDSNEVFNVNRWTTYNRLDNYFTFSKTFTGDIGFTYHNKFAYGNYIIDEQSNVSVGLQKTLWNRRATVSFYANDIFNKLVYTTETRYSDQYMHEYSDLENRTFEINFTYKFGNYRLRDNSKGIDKEERDRI